MKIEINKRRIYILLGGLLLLSCIQINNVKLIMDQDSLLGFELDFSDMEFSLRGTASTKTVNDIAVSGDAAEPAEVRP